VGPYRNEPSTPAAVVSPEVPGGGNALDLRGTSAAGGANREVPPGGSNAPDRDLGGTSAAVAAPTEAPEGAALDRGTSAAGGAKREVPPGAELRGNNTAAAGAAETQERQLEREELLVVKDINGAIVFTVHRVWRVVVMMMGCNDDELEFEFEYRGREVSVILYAESDHSIRCHPSFSGDAAAGPATQV